MDMNQAKPFGVKVEHELWLLKDVLIEILIYLPVKSLIRFRSVSNNWFDLIKSQTFVTRHLGLGGRETLLLKRSLPPGNDDEILQQRKTLLSFHDSDSLESLVLPNLYVPFLGDTIFHEYVNLFGPCNGLICLTYDNIIILCNPALREFKLLAPTPFACPEEYIIRFKACGFGFDAKTNSYKLVQLWDIDDYPNDDNYIRIDLYNSSTNSWRQIDTIVPDVNYNIGFDLLFNGAIHWWANEFIDGPPPMRVILSFHFSTEVFKLFEFPYNEDKYPSLVVLNQCLALVYYGGWQCGEPILVDIWVMKEYGVKESWTKELVIGPYILRYPFVSLKNEWIVVEIYGQLACCALHANECREYQFKGFDGSLNALILIESLISLKVAFC